MQAAKLVMISAVLALAPLAVNADERIPESGDKAIEFKGNDLNGDLVDFQPAKGSDWTVLIFLRGFPGYQCPICSRQVSELLSKADDLVSAKAKLIFIYPGPSLDLTNKAQEFLVGKSLPTGFQLVVDPDYKIVNAYRLRWDAPRETAFPATFVIDPTGFIRFAKVSKTHGDRATVKEILDVIPSKSVDVKKDTGKK